MSFLKNEIDTICAISSPSGEGAISIIRASGADCLHILKKIFRPYRKDLSDIKSRFLYIGRIFDFQTESFVDEAACVFIKGPNSYTGEDMFEIYPHGGVFNTKYILEIILKSGARLAYNGEFTKRAYLNNKISLVKAEAILEIIKANSLKTLVIANNELSGLLEKKIEKIKEDYLYMLASVEALIDFPEEEFENINADFLKKAEESAELILELIESYENYELNKRGFSIVIAGQPNVGKSSILNKLLDKNRAIVSDIPGTTRDYIEENLFLSNKPVKIIDTAGLRETENEIEYEGIKVSYSQIKNADAVLYVFDVNDLTENEILKEILEEKENVVPVVNKLDTLVVKNLKTVENKIIKEFKFTNNPVFISAKTGEGFESMKTALYDIIIKSESGVKDDVGITTIRQKNLLLKSLNFLERAKEKFKEGSPLELVSIDLRDGIKSLDEIIGSVTNEDVLDVLFKEFCIGK
ncbi:MAG: tRNA uridine-5-carboxymethylaminomethyl(34) synthesis GTPase MnmE [Candidatus Acidulodesulfobacterium acidiphilum]|uniref:tRNA modification GTPase MnmE n=1 Tax=Candidatus Acidulodesulfobacterium acidiphilum TaxID=2597224 RepID=A0A520XH17_9DELT|nr:MAG: tRNA uridine-5-carboxymethylaminomethyl(34) synthesis GTPase MnmE [Candidatus Acidulodesulfobacterium acidiphilum]